MSKKIEKWNVTSDSEIRIKIEFIAARTDLIDLISMVKKIAKLIIPADDLSLNVQQRKRTGSRADARVGRYVPAHDCYQAWLECW